MHTQLKKATTKHVELNILVFHQHHLFPSALYVCVPIFVVKYLYRYVRISDYVSSIQLFFRCIVLVFSIYTIHACMDMYSPTGKFLRVIFVVAHYMFSGVYHFSLFFSFVVHYGCNNVKENDNGNINNNHTTFH